jgi:hypothetical protein
VEESSFPVHSKNDKLVLLISCSSLILRNPTLPQEMLGQMANVRVVEDTQEDLQEAMAGGERLYFEAFNIGSMKLTRQETRVRSQVAVLPDPLIEHPPPFCEDRLGRRSKS